VAYMTLPESQSSILLPTFGFILVCMPWLFWISTVLYRIVSRAFGFRMVIGSLYGNGGFDRGAGGGGGGAATVDDHIDDAQVLDVNAKSPPSSPENYEGRRVQFGEAMVIGDDKKGDNSKRGGSSSSSSSNDISRTSHESEMPLALSMAS